MLAKAPKLVLIDTHAHLDFDQFHRDHSRVISKAKSGGVLKIINVGSSVVGSRNSLSLSWKYKEVYASCGIHPQEAPTTTGEAMKEILELSKNSRVVAIGEIGLDYKDLKEEAAKGKQKEVFKTQIGIGKQRELPLIIHCREAFLDVLQILSLESHNLRGVFHCFSEGIAEAREVLNFGFFISFTANITYPENKNLREIVKLVPLDRIMLETDSPFLPPQRYRGNRNEPAYIVEVAKEIAKLKNLSLKQVAEQTTKNAKALFGI